MESLLLARWQFAITTVYHFLFVPLTIGLAFFVAIMETKYVRSNDEKYKEMTKFWGKLFLINFAIGVATGIVQEFQFGMNWSGYSRMVGDVFGAPLAIEALATFFVESTFLGIWIFGWDKLSKKVHALCIWLVFLASMASAFWILVANSFMQNPVGYVMNNGRAEMNDFFALIVNPHFLYQYPHVITAALTTAGFFVIGISAYHILKGNRLDLFNKSFKYGVVVAIIGAISVSGIGHLQGQRLVIDQPMKMAAAEAHWETEDPADFVAVAMIDEENGTNTWEIKIPYMLSFLSYNSFSGEVRGMHDLQAEMVAAHGEGNYIPPVTINFWSFRIMIAAGSLMVLLALIGAYLYKTDKLIKCRKYLKLMIFAMILPYIANSTGWILAEVGRQPWVVYGVQTVADGVSKVVSSATILVSLIGFTAIYTVLGIVMIWLMIKYAKKVPSGQSNQEESEEVSLWI